MTDNTGRIQEEVNSLSSEMNYSLNETAVILAAGHGKRIKSQKSKMLHKIWGVPTVERVYNACADSGKMNIVMVVGIKASDVMNVIGQRDNLAFAYQAEQKGTGHAVQIGMEKLDRDKFEGVLYVLPGDMGLIEKETINLLRNKFNESNSDMMVLTGIYKGPVMQNSYGRIIRVKERDTDGNPAGDDKGKVIEIMENKDIHALDPDEGYIAEYNGREYKFSREELIENREFNSGVYAFKFDKLKKLIYEIDSDNAQGEIYITDLIGLFNSAGYTVSAISPDDPNVVMGFNDKTVLKEMENAYRHKVYEKIGNIVEIEDPEDFYVSESVVEELLELDNEGTPLDIKIGKGVYIGKGTKLNYNCTLHRNVYIDGNVHLGRNVHIWQNVHLSCYPTQKFKIGNNVEILWGDIIKGNIAIGESTRIESSVNMTGSDTFPLRIGKNVLIKGTSYIFGSVIEDDVKIEHSVLIKKKVNRVEKRNGDIQAVRFFLPMPAGVDSIEKLDQR